MVSVGYRPAKGATPTFSTSRKLLNRIAFTLISASDRLSFEAKQVQSLVTAGGLCANALAGIAMQKRRAGSLDMRRVSELTKRSRSQDRRRPFVARQC